MTKVLYPPDVSAAILVYSDSPNDDFKNASLVIDRLYSENLKLNKVIESMSEIHTNLRKDSAILIKENKDLRLVVEGKTL